MDALIDLSKASKLKDITLHFQYLSVAWIASMLKTITSGHIKLQEVSIGGEALPDSGGWPANAADVDDDTREQWEDLERTLIQLWESHAICTKVKYYSMRREESRELMEDLLPEARERGIVELVDTTIPYWS